MTANDMANWRTSIAEVVSTETEEEILVRGRKLSDLIGSVSFAEMMFLLLTGREATKPQARVLDALLVASIEHGIAPPSMIARCYASYGTSIQAAMAGGIMAFGDTMGGAGEALAKLLSEAVASVDGDPNDEDLHGLATEASPERAGCRATASRCTARTPGRPRCWRWRGRKAVSVRTVGWRNWLNRKSWSRLAKPSRSISTGSAPR